MNRRNGKFFYFMLIFFVLVLGYLSFEIARPFLAPIGWAIVFTIVFYPLYVLALKYLKFKSLAALFTVLVLIVLLLGPISYFGYMLVNELVDLAQHLEAGHVNVKYILAHPKVEWIISKLKSIPALEEINVERMITQAAGNIRTAILAKITGAAKNLFEMGAGFILMLFTSFFLLKDGPDFSSKIKDYLPFSERHKNKLEKQVKDMVISTIYGGILVAMIQGVIGGVAFWALGIPGFVLWGSAIFIFSFVPLLGTAAIWAPASIYLFLSGQTVKGVVLFLIGVLIISMVDNLLKPIIISGRTRMHTLFIFFSVLGGINVFGILGLVMGPLTVALFVSVLDIFGRLEEEGGANAEP
jgi:predicted PurR-regulated permease PerM